jgi:threonylcarbamoyladenosine tRNA methylthiotransferase MtaB
MRNFAANGFKEVVLTGIHLGAYGLDLQPPTSLTALVRQIDDEQIVPRLRVGSIEPNEVTEELLNLMATSKSICPHLHLPLQSGSDSVLKRMGRPYNSAMFRDLMSRTTSLIPNVFIGADVIAGFPGETEAEFNETVMLLEEMPFSDLHVFPYSSRPGTKAADMPGHLPAYVITERAARLREIATTKKQSFLVRFIGEELLVLVQEFNQKTGTCRGLSRNYVTVSCPGEASFINREIKVVVQKCGDKYCSGELSTEIKSRIWNSPDPA